MNDINIKSGELMLPDGRIVSFNTQASTVFLQNKRTVEEVLTELCDTVKQINSELDELVEV